MSSLSAQRLLESKDLSAKAVWVRCCIAALKRWAAQILNLATLSITQHSAGLRSAGVPPTLWQWNDVVKSEDAYADETYDWNLGCHRHCRTALRPNAGASSVVRSSVACGFGSLRRQVICRSSALADEDSHARASSRDACVTSDAGGRSQDHLRGTGFLDRRSPAASFRRSGLRGGFQ